MKNYEIEKETLYNNYIEQNLSISDISSKFKLTPRRISYLLNVYGIKKTNEQRYLTIREKTLKKYGCISTLVLPEINKKSRETCIKKYGERYALQNKIIYDKVIDTNLKRYGCKYTGQVKEIRDKQKKTCFIKYGAENPMQNEQVKEKVQITKRKNKSFTVSKQEITIFELLSKRFSEVKCQYKSSTYPFNCDFYIPVLDLYIEYQGFWNHNTHPFNKADFNDQEILSTWKERAKTHSGYKTAIDVWTVRDPLKRKTAKENNLNWVEFFTMKDFLEWFNFQISET